jgi:hypothetical protein
MIQRETKSRTQRAKKKKNRQRKRDKGDSGEKRDKCKSRRQWRAEGLRRVETAGDGGGGGADSGRVDGEEIYQGITAGKTKGQGTEGER